MATHSSILTWRTGTENWKKKKKVSLVCVNIFRMWICAVDLINDDSISIFEFWGFIKLVGAHVLDIIGYVCACSHQSCMTLCDPMDCSLPGSSVHGILQVGRLGWVAISFSRGSSQHRERTLIS